MDRVASFILTTLMVGLRVAPVFSFAPPFTLTRVPTLVRVMFGVAMSAALVGGIPAGAWLQDFSTASLVITGARELFLGATFVMALQIMFSGLYVAGRTIDIQAGFGLAMLIDPTSRVQTPLVGTLFALLAGVVFFGMNGHLDLLRLMASSFRAIPIGSGLPPADLGRLCAFISTVFLISLGVGGGVILTLFLADLAISLMSRTMPQMNVLVLGFQIKPVLMVIALSVSLGLSGALLARLARITLEALPELL